MDLQAQFEKAQNLRNNGQIDEAVKLYEQIRIKALDQEPRLAAEFEHMIGVAYYQDKKYELAREHLSVAEIEYTQLHDKEMLAGVLRDLGMVAAVEEQFDEAEDYYRKSIEILEETSNLGQLGITKIKLGKLLSRKNLGQAEKKILEGISDTEGSLDRFFTSTGYFDLAQLKLKQGKKKDAKVWGEKSLKLLNQISKKNQFTSRRKELGNFLKSL